MRIHHEHPWNLDSKAAIALQNQLRRLVKIEDELPADIRRVAGVDVGFEDEGKVTRAAVAVLDYPGLGLIESSIARLPTVFPYVPGLLSFREVPAILKALAGLAVLPDLLLVDGQGYAHPRRLGIACHLGLLTDLPSIGVGKTRLCGRHEEVPDEKGRWVPLVDKQEIIGAVLRTRRGVQPIYVSAGHRIGLETAVEWVLRCTGRFRLPETTRQAHRLASGWVSGAGPAPGP
ncbi:Endonuclease V [Methylomagnum ishizawai]|uniref:Endonuclease V n=1 Tax=Methylomagnum ishizawai TaxID=1760988 RepID=A0A1Y6CTC0_9GAMM|nr:deoxyribonuclease V [Methylomagnum ishizawai]SMF93671.1 Endonuclease V [Methylomagnum ishizawai]